MGNNYVISRILEPTGVHIANIIELKVFAVLSLSYIECSRFDFSLGTSSDLITYSSIQRQNDYNNWMNRRLFRLFRSRTDFSKKKVQPVANGKLQIFRIPLAEHRQHLFHDKLPPGTLLVSV